MNLRRIKHMFIRLSPEEKGIGIGGLLVVLGSFMPWYIVNDIIREKVDISYGFSNDIGIIGFVVFLIVILALIVLISDHLHFYLPKFGHKKEQILLFLMGEGAFLNLILVAIYTKRSLIPINADLRFGIYITLIGSLIGVLSAFALNQKTKKDETEAFFDHSDEDKEIIHESQSFNNDTFLDKAEDKEEYNNQLEIEEDEVTPEEEMIEEFIAEEVIPEDDVVEEVVIEELIPEDDMIDEIIVEEAVIEEEPPVDQANYFMREAGMNKEEEKVEEDIVDTFNEILEEVAEEIDEEIAEEVAEEIFEEVAEEIAEEIAEEVVEEIAEEIFEEEVAEEIAEKMADNSEKIDKEKKVNKSFGSFYED